MAQESTIENHFVNRVNALGGFSLKSDKIPGRRFLDRIAFLPGGVTLVVELKRPKGGRYSAHQLETIRRLEEMGHVVHRCHTKEQVDQLMERVSCRNVQST